MFDRKKSVVKRGKGVTGNNSHLREARAVIVSDFLPYHIQKVDL